MKIEKKNKNIWLFNNKFIKNLQNCFNYSYLLFFIKMIYKLQITLQIYFFKINFILIYFFQNKIFKEFFVKQINYKNQIIFLNNSFNVKNHNYFNSYNNFFFNQICNNDLILRKKILLTNDKPTSYCFYFYKFFFKQLFFFKKNTFYKFFIGLEDLASQTLNYLDQNLVNWGNFKFNLKLKKNQIKIKKSILNNFYMYFKFLNNKIFLMKINQIFQILISDAFKKIKNYKNNNRRKYKSKKKILLKTVKINTKRGVNFKLNVRFDNKRNLFFYSKNDKIFFYNNLFIKNIFNIFNWNVFIKFLYWTNFKLNNEFFHLLIKNYINTNYYFYSQKNFLLLNYFANEQFHFIFKKQVAQLITYNTVGADSMIWHHTSMIRTLENLSGRKVAIRIYTYLNVNLDYYESMRCILWSKKLQYFQKIIGHGFFLLESLQIIYLALKLKDMPLLINWATKLLHKISFWKHRFFFHYLRYVFKYFFWSVFKELKVKGIKFKLKGKISVAGNARTRSVSCQIGKLSPATYNHKILHALDLIRTFTGVMGFQIWLVF